MCLPLILSILLSSGHGHGNVLPHSVHCVIITDYFNIVWYLHKWAVNFLTRIFSKLSQLLVTRTFYPKGNDGKTVLWTFRTPPISTLRLALCPLFIFCQFLYKIRSCSLVILFAVCVREGSGNFTTYGTRAFFKKWVSRFPAELKGVNLKTKLTTKKFQHLQTRQRF